jgi:hypothetical protein
MRRRKFIMLLGGPLRHGRLLRERNNADQNRALEFSGTLLVLSRNTNT